MVVRTKKEVLELIKILKIMMMIRIHINKVYLFCIKSLNSKG